MTFNPRQRNSKKGYEDLKKTIDSEKEKERQFTKLSKEITKLTHEISQNNTRVSLNQKQDQGT